MKFRVEKSFSRDINDVKDKKVLQKLKEYIFKIENADDIRAISKIKKIEGFDVFYRIRIGDYATGRRTFSQ